MKSDKEEIAKLFELEKLLNERMSTSLVNHMAGVRFMPPKELREAIETITKESREALKEVSIDETSMFLGQWSRPPHLETPIAIETYKIVNVEPCPYCEADAANDMETDNGKQKFLVYCSNEEGCGACGPWANTREEAEELWNSVARDVMYAKAKRTAEIKLNHMK